MVHIMIYLTIDVVEEVCTVELEEPIAVAGSSAAFSIRGVGSDIVRFSCKLDGVQLTSCMPIHCDFMGHRYPLCSFTMQVIVP